MKNYITKPMEERKTRWIAETKGIQFDFSDMAIITLLSHISRTLTTPPTSHNLSLISVLRFKRLLLQYMASSWPSQCPNVINRIVLNETIDMISKRNQRDGLFVNLKEWIVFKDSCYVSKRVGKRKGGGGKKRERDCQDVRRETQREREREEGEGEEVRV